MRATRSPGSRGGCGRLAAVGLALLPLAAVAVPVGPALSAPSGQGRPGSAAGAASLSVEAARGRLSVALRQAPLEAVLDAVRRETGVEVRVHGPVARALSDRFRGLPIEEALRRLFRPFNVAFVYAPRQGRGEEAQLAEVIIYPPGRSAPAGSVAAAGAGGPGVGLAATEGGAPSGGPAGSSAPARATGQAPVAAWEGVPQDVEQRLARLEADGDAGQTGARGDDGARAAAARELTELLADPNPEVRHRALEAAQATRLVAPEALRSLALADPDVQVRRAALAALLATAGRPAAAAAALEGLGDRSAAVRLAALEALGEQIGGPAGESAARAALDDPDPFVRAKAAELIQIFEEARHAPSEDDEEDADEERAPGQSGARAGRANCPAEVPGAPAGRLACPDESS